jgi:hypothetical protein
MMAQIMDQMMDNKEKRSRKRIERERREVEEGK